MTLADLRPDLRAGLQRGVRNRTNAYVYVLVAAICTQVFTGSANLFGLPIGVDRLLFVLGLLMLLVTERGRLLAGMPPVKTLLVLFTLTACLVSAIVAGTVRERFAVFDILDSFGVIPFFLLLSAPVVFRDEVRRRVLLTGLTVTGLYLGVTACLEGVHAYALVWPSYIGDPSVGLAFGRARGPFLTSGAEGLALIMCSIAAVLLLLTTTSRVHHALVYASVLTCAAGVFFTLTRTVWIAYAVAFTIVMLSQRRLWKWWGLLVGAATLTVAFALSLSSSLQEQVVARLGDERSGMDRLNANSAAFEILRHHPLTGVGWHRFSAVEVEWLWQNDSYPMTQTGIPVHNVFLGYAAEIGIPGALGWIALLVVATAAAVRRPWPAGTPRWWPVATLTLISSWVVCAMLLPITYAFPSAVLWTFLGVAAQVRDSSDVGTRKSMRWL